MKFRRQALRQKLLSVFAGLLFTMVLLAGLGISGMKTIDGASDRLHNEALKPTQALAVIGRLMADNRSQDGFAQCQRCDRLPRITEITHPNFARLEQGISEFVAGSVRQSHDFGKLTFSIGFARRTRCCTNPSSGCGCVR